jgi:tripartite-type tricarboxylate transporter receptor subunit TctC
MAHSNVRWLSVLVAAIAAIASVVPAAGAQSRSKGPDQVWPVRPVRIIVAFSPGSASDIIARLLAPKLSDLWGQPVVIENRSGAGGSIAFAMAAQASPDGYTLVLVTSSLAINAVLRPNVGYDPLRDFASVVQLGYPTGVLAVSPALGVRR